MCERDDTARFSLLLLGGKVFQDEIEVSEDAFTGTIDDNAGTTAVDAQACAVQQSMVDG